MAPNADGNQIDPSVAELRVNTETVHYINREPPPPYTPPGISLAERPIIHQTVVIQAPLRDKPMLYECATCRETVLTSVRYVSSRKTHLLAGFICGFTLWCFICCLAAIPYMVPAFKKAEHYCPICQKFLGSYTKM